MRFEKLFRVLVAGGISLGGGSAGCGSSDDPSPSDRSLTGSGGTNDDAGQHGDVGPTQDGDANSCGQVPAGCESKCTLSPGPCWWTCEGVCCWLSAHPCCP